MESIYALSGTDRDDAGTVEDALMLIEAVAIDDPVICSEHKCLIATSKPTSCPKRLPTDARASPGRARSNDRQLQRSGIAAQELCVKVQAEVVDLRTVKPLDTDTVLLHQSCAPGACCALANRFRGVARLQR
jgi:pyruvate/2-oxoglutarate/acetoin dehydrogenase E1 component